MNEVRSKIPRTTYRFQFHEKFTLKQATALVPYLHDLGISHVYASPLFKARPHSTHGYDTCDFNQLNPELGTEADLEELVAALHQRDMGLVLDIVPNHMGIGGPENRWWWDVLAHGPQSQFAKYFDIDWESPDPRLRGKVLLPVLGDRYHHVLEKGQVTVEAHGKESLLRYGENTFPINEQSLAATKATPAELNANPAALDELIERQHYRLAWYGRGDAELNYRRFFNITSLPGIRMENEKVFEQVFALTKTWIERGWLDGLRVDHPDGLRDPQEFLHRLRALAPGLWIVVEKILEPGEWLPSEWPVAGTTGYDFLNQAGGLFVNTNNESALDYFYLTFSETSYQYEPLARDKKRLVLQTLLAAEVEHLVDLLLRVAAAHSKYRDFTREELRDALIEFAVGFPVYRSYARPAAGLISDAGIEYIREAADEAKNARPNLPAEAVQLPADLLLLKEGGAIEEEFVARFQQLSSATMAKGVEDTAFYCYNRFVALNEVGGNPECFGTEPDSFHKFCQTMQTRWPETMLASSTHDTKRSEDVRSRLYLLSEIPALWGDTAVRWSKLNKKYRRAGWPDRNAEYLYYQTLVGAWPVSEERMIAYMQKATREAKEHTNWNNGDPEYDAALQDFIADTFSDEKFIDEIEKFAALLSKPACINSLAQTLLKLTAPGVPDIYQGTELWDFSLVDPDNRRLVDFDIRREYGATCGNLSAAEAWGEWESGITKMWLTRRVLHLRRSRPDLFGSTAVYEPVLAEGAAREHVVAFMRGGNMLVLVPRLVIGLQDSWADTTVELPGFWRNELTDEMFAGHTALVSELLRRFPVALLTREDQT